MLILPVVDGHLPAARACSCIALAPEELLRMAEAALEGTAVHAAEPGAGAACSDELVAADGRVLAFGAAPGEVTGMPPGRRAGALATVPGGGLLVPGADGNVAGLGGAATFGDARPHGTLAGVRLRAVVGPSG